MARQPRLTLAGHTYHLIQRGNNRQPIFTDDADRRDMLRLLLEASREHQVTVHSYVLMDNHVHLLVTPATAEGMPKMMQQVGRAYVRHFNDRVSRSGTLFEGRYRSALVQTERYLLACMVYIELNPVRAGLVTHPKDFAWSSHAHYADIKPSPLVTPHPHFFTLGNTPFAREQSYLQIVQTGLSQSEERKITETTLRNHGLGDASFIEKLELQTQLKLQLGQKGRPTGSLSSTSKRKKIN
ncbi:MAG: transposase [Brachymonas sp.]|nr:transposase [Brachymonas sp.]